MRGSDRDRMTRFFVRRKHRFFVPTCRQNDDARSGRQGGPSLCICLTSTVARPRLDGREHAVMITVNRGQL
jgi:hypothetical protein